MNRWVVDYIDQMCIDWADQRRKALGIVLGRMMEPHERLGKMRSTLAAVRDEGEGASYSTMSQAWPEVYVGTSLVVHRCWHGMRSEWKEVMHVHYVWRELPVVVRCASIKVGLETYYKRLGLLKPFVDQYVGNAEKMYEINMLNERRMLNRKR